MAYYVSLMIIDGVCVCVDFFFFFFPCHMASGILVLWPEIEIVAHGIESTES